MTYYGAADELQRAAEAVVDAALLRRYLETSKKVSDELREALIEAVLQDPTVVESLFRSEERYYS